MKNSLLCKVTSTLSPKERIRFSQFINSSYFNSGARSKKIIQLWDLINSELDQPNKPLPSKEKLFEHLFPKQAFNLGKMKKLMHLVVQLINQFMVIENKALDNTTVFSRLELQYQYLKRGLSNEAKTKIKSLIKEQKKKKKTAKNLYDQFLINEAKFYQDNMKINRKEDLNLPSVLLQLDDYYLFTRLEYTFQMLAINQWVCPIDFTQLLDRLDLNLEHLPPDLKESPVFSLYLFAYRLLKNFPQNNTSIFKKFLQVLDDNRSFCTDEQLKAFQTFSRNFCIYFYNEGLDEFSQLAFNLYKNHLEEGLLYHEGKIFAGTFHNLVLLGIRNQKLAWVRAYIEEHRNKILGSDQKELAYQFGLATLAFHQGEYEKALDLLQHPIQDQHLKLAARRLEIMIFYELNSDILLSKLEAYKIYVYRLKKDVNLQRSRDQNKNFVDILRQIVHPKTMSNSKRIQKILQKIETVKNLAEKPWLRKKLLALSNEAVT